MIPINTKRIEQIKEKWLTPLIEKSIAGVEYTRGRTNTLTKRFTFDLSNAGSQTIHLQGDFIYGIEAQNSTDEVEVSFSRKDTGNSHTITKGLGFYHPFDVLHFTWSAQNGNSEITVIVGNLAPDLFGIIDNRSGVTQTELLEDILDAVDIGIPAGGTEIKAEVIANYAASATVYTVPAGKTLYILESSVVAFDGSTGGGNIASLYDGSSWFNSVGIYVTSGTIPHESHIIHRVPIEYNEGTVISIRGYDSLTRSTAQALNMLGYIRGYTI